MSKKEIEDYVRLLSDKVAKNVEIVSKEDLGQDFFLHISLDNMSRRKYIPWISERQGSSEDRTVPRITVSDSLLGCIHGFASLFHCVINFAPSEDFYKQGLYIHEITFDHALKPTAKLVGDQKESNEHWLVTYNQDTREYKGRLIGKLFITKLSIMPDGSESGSNYLADIAIEITKPEGIKLSENIFLEKGYWLFRYNHSKHNKHNKDDKLFYRKMSDKEYSEAKAISASMLSLSDKLPHMVKW